MPRKLQASTEALELFFPAEIKKREEEKMGRTVFTKMIRSNALLFHLPTGSSFDVSTECINYICHSWSKNIQAINLKK